MSQHERPTDGSATGEPSPAARRARAVRRTVDAQSTTGAHPHGEDLERFARLVAERVAQRLALRSKTPAGSVTADEVAKEIGVTAQWVRAHADELGARRLGNGPKPRLRFDLEVVAERLASRSAGEGSQPAKRPPHRPLSASGPTRMGSDDELLPIRAVHGAKRSTETNREECT